MKLPKLITKNMILNIAIIILALIIANNIHKFQLKGMQRLQERKAEELKKNAKIENIVQLKKRLDDYKQLIGEKDVSVLLDNISDIAKNSRVKINSIKPEPEQAYSAYILYPFSVSCGAKNYHDIGKFISSLESDANIYIVENINIKPGTQTYGASKEKSDNLQADLKISTVLFRQ